MAETLDQLAQRLRGAAETRLRAALVGAMTQVTQGLAQGAITNIDARTTAHTRQLRSSVRHEIEAEASVVVGRVKVGGEYAGLSVPYARLQEYGGTVRPIKGKYLAIPTADGLTSAGTPRYPSPRMMPFVAFVAPKEKGGVKWLVIDKRNNQVFFVLVSQVTIPAKRYLADALDVAVRALPDALVAAARAALGVG